MNAAIILAGGTGNRFGAALPKQYIEVLGKPVLAYTLETFQSSPDIDMICVVCQPEYRDRVSMITEKYNISKLAKIASGSESCPASIRNGIYALRDALAPSDNVILHMGVSPLISQADISSVLETCSKMGCCFTMHPVNICMARRGGDGWTESDAPKEDYIELNVPWAFRFSEICSLYESRESTGCALSDSDYTLSLWLASGRRAYYIPGSPPGRLKITTTHDRDLLEGYLMLRQSRLNKQEEYHE